MDNVTKIAFIPGKNISTKSIKDKAVTIHVEVPRNFDWESHINRPLKLKADYQGESVTFDCSIPNEGNAFSYSGNHDNCTLKLDVVLGNLLLIGYLTVADLSLTK